MFIFKKILLVYLLIIVSGCATGPMKSEIDAISDRKFADSLPTNITVEDKTEIVTHDFDYIDIKKELDKEISKQNKEIGKPPPNVNMKFTYYKCEITGHYPTDSKGLNVFIRIITFGVFPIGNYKKCPSSLEVTDPGTNNVIAKYSTILEAKDGGGLIDNLGFLPELKKQQRVRIPLKKLILEFQNDGTK